MKIKVIELLIDKASGKIIKKFKIQNRIFKINSAGNYLDEDTDDLFSDIYNVESILNDEVEIIEDKPKKIEKIGMHFSFGYIDTDNRKLVFSELDKNLNLFGNKIDELIDKVNEMSKDD